MTSPIGTIAVCIPSIPTRKRLLQRALNSVRKQTLQPDQVHVALDTEKNGAATTRDQAMRMATTDWVAFLDDDDEFMGKHLDRLVKTVRETAADYAYAHYIVKGGYDPFPSHFGRVFDPLNPHQTTITILVRTELALEAGFLNKRTDPDALREKGRPNGNEDWFFTLECVQLGAKIVHRPERTWIWHHHTGNTSGLPTRW